MTTKDEKSLRLECVREAIRKDRIKTIDGILQDAGRIYNFVMYGTTGKQEDDSEYVKVKVPFSVSSVKHVITIKGSDGKEHEWQWDGERMVKVPISQ